MWRPAPFGASFSRAPRVPWVSFSASFRVGIVVPVCEAGLGGGVGWRHGQGAASSVGAAAFPTQRGCLRPDRELLAQDCVDELAGSAVRPIFFVTHWQAAWNVHALVSHGVLSGMVFAAVTRGRFGSRVPGPQSGASPGNRPGREQGRF